VVLTTATVLAEIHGNGEDGLRARIGQTVRRSVIHPVTLPIMLGLAYHATGLPLPAGRLMTCWPRSAWPWCR
jgi:hypothetical protein